MGGEPAEAGKVPPSAAAASGRSKFSRQAAIFGRYGRQCRLPWPPQEAGELLVKRCKRSPRHRTSATERIEVVRREELVRTELHNQLRATRVGGRSRPGQVDLPHPSIRGVREVPSRQQRPPCEHIHLLAFIRPGEQRLGVQLQLDVPARGASRSEAAACAPHRFPTRQNLPARANPTRGTEFPLRTWRRRATHRQV